MKFAHENIFLQKIMQLIIVNINFNKIVNCKLPLNAL